MLDPSCVGDGWGVGWGNSPWGGAEDSEIRLLSAVAIAENVIRFEFSVAPFFTGTLEPGDSSDPSRFSVVADPATIGMDGRPARPVSPVLVAVAVADVSGGAGRFLDVTVDRPLSPYPAVYTASANGIVTADGFGVDPCAASQKFFGLLRRLVPGSPDLLVPSRDFANPQTLAAALDPLPNPADPANLGTYVVGDSGDYEYDEGLTNYKKRVLRRITTKKGAFSFDPTYGVGVPAQVKTLARPALLAALAADAEAQIALEPETDKVKVSFVPDAQNPGLFRFRVLVRTKKGQAFSLVGPVPGGIFVSL